MRSTENIELLLKNLGEDWTNISPEELAQRVEALHGMQIEFFEMPMPKNYFGACMVVVEEEISATGFVFYAPNLNATLKSHVKTHEVAHLALGHNTVVLSFEELEKIQHHPELLLSSDKTIACRAMTASPNLSRKYLQEQEAENLTRTIYDKHFAARQRQHLEHASSYDDMDEALHRMGIA